MQSTEFQEQTSNNKDFKELFFKYLAFLHWFILSLIITLTIAFFYLRYGEETYDSTNVIKILDNNNSGFKMPTDALSFLTNEKVNLENEIEIIQSSILIEKVVDSLDLQNLYFTKGKIKETEIGSDAPFSIYWTEAPEKVALIDLSFDLKLTPKGYYLSESTDLKSFGKTYIYKGHPFYIVNKSLYKKKLSGEYEIVKVNKEAIIQSVKSQLVIEKTSKESELLRLKVTSSNPKKAADIANMLAALFNQDGIKDRQLVHQKTVDFVDQRFGFLFKELDSIESNKASYKQGQSLVDFQADAAVLATTKSGTVGELNATKIQAVLSEILIETVGKTTSNELLPANIGLEQVEVAAIINQYNELVLKQLKLLQSVGDKHPAVLELRETQKELKNNIKSSLATYKKVLQSKIAAISQISFGESQQYAAFPFQEKTIRSIERQQEIKEALYIILLQKREEAAVNLAVISPSIKMVDYAKPSSIPISPKRTIIYLAASLLGILIPFVVIYLYYLLDTKIHTKKDVEEIVNDIPIIVEIPHIESEDKMVKNQDRSTLSEAFRMLRTNLSFLLNKNSESNIIFCSSTIKGEGKTFVSMNIAITTEMLGKKTIIVGADLRNPQLHKMLNVPRSNFGLSNFLSDTNLYHEDIIVDGNKFNLGCDFIFSGPIPPNPSELLSNGRLEILLKELKKKYEIIIVDTAPTLLVTDTIQIAKLSDLFLFVVRANYSEKKLLNFINELKGLNKIDNLAIVLNNLGEQKGYGYKYSYLYNYNYKYNYKYKYNYGYGYGYGADETKKTRKRSLWTRFRKWFKIAKD